MEKAQQKESEERVIAEMQSKATLDQIQNGPLPHVPGLDGIPSRKARDRAVEMAYGTCAKGMNRIFGGKFGSLNERFQDIQANQAIAKHRP